MVIMNNDVDQNSENNSNDLTMNRDKEILAHYIRSVEEALEQAKRQLAAPTEGSTSSQTTITLSKLLLNADLIPTDIGKAGPELIACQVRLF